MKKTSHNIFETLSLLLTEYRQRMKPSTLHQKNPRSCIFRFRLPATISLTISANHCLADHIIYQTTSTAHLSFNLCSNHEVLNHSLAPPNHHRVHLPHNHHHNCAPLNYLPTSLTIIQNGCQRSCQRFWWYFSRRCHSFKQWGQGWSSRSRIGRMWCTK